MINSPFEKFGIKHLSASSVNLWRSQPGLWAVRYLLKPDKDESPAIWRGNAVEKGLEAWIRGQSLEDAQALALHQFEMNAQGDLSEDVEKERKCITEFVKQGTGILTPREDFLGCQHKIELWLDDISVPFIGFIDQLYPKCGKEIKTTHQLPSKPKPEHCRQVALYEVAKQRPFSLVYLTSKKSAEYPVENAKDHVEALRRDAMSLERYLARCSTIEDAVACLPKDTDDFRWSNAARQSLSQTVLIGA